MTLSPPAFASFPQFETGCRTEPTRSFCESAWRAASRQLETIESTNGPQFLLRTTKLDLPALNKAAGALFARHTVLNSLIEERQGLPWIVTRSSSEPDVNFLDFSSGHTPADRNMAEQAIANHVWQPFNLAEGPLARVFAVNFANLDYYIGFVGHHYVVDSLSLDVIAHDLTRLYRACEAGEELELPSVKVDYRNYLNTINSWIDSDGGRAMRAAMFDRVKQIGGLRFASDTSDRGGPVLNPFRFSEKTVSQVRELARRFRTTVFTIFLAAQKILIYPYCLTPCATIRIITSGRDVPVLANVVGNMADRLYALTDLSGNPAFSDVIVRINQSMRTCRQQGFVRDDFVIADLKAHGISTTAPVFNFMQCDELSVSSPSGQDDALKILPPHQEPRRPGNHYYLKMFDDGREIFGNIRYGTYIMPDVLSALETLVNTCHANPDITISELNRKAGFASGFY